jgi:hypothetical protein
MTESARREIYRATLIRQREGLQSMTDGLREYLIAPIEAELQGLKSDPLPERSEIINRLTEDLMAAQSEVEMIASQVEQLREMFATLDPSSAAMIQPFMPMFNGFLRPMVEQAHMKASRRRDEIQSELMEYETSEAATQLSRQTEEEQAPDSTGGL